MLYELAVGRVCHLKGVSEAEYFREANGERGYKTSDIPGTVWYFGF
jgi:hypothetical protein